MRRALPLVALAAFLLLSPAASAQSDPEAVVAAACALAGDARELLPVCPREEPAAPAQAPEPAPQQAPADAPNAGEAAALAGEAQDAVQDVAEDPASAPDRLAGLLATLLQFLRDLLSLPARGVDLMTDAGAALGAALAAGAGAVADATASVASKVAGVAGSAWDALAGLFMQAGADAAAPAPALPEAGAPSVAVDGLLARTLDALPAA